MTNTINRHIVCANVILVACFVTRALELGRHSFSQGFSVTALHLSGDICREINLVEKLGIVLCTRFIYFSIDVHTLTNNIYYKNSRTSYKTECCVYFVSCNKNVKR